MSDNHDFHVRYWRAWLVGSRAGCDSAIYRVEDKWGGYWQCRVPGGGVYTFSTK